jgi:hypothetical protein
VIGASADGSAVYFVADGKLAQGAVAGDCEGFGFDPALACNLYRHDEAGTTLIAVLSGADQPDWANGEPQLSKLTARVSPDGQWLAFMSQSPLTGYDNRDAVSGEPDQEVYLFHAAAPGRAASLLCASCDPTGARPHGVEYRKLNDGIAGGDRIFALDQWVAAEVPGWTPNRIGVAGYQSRYLGDGGRLFFDSSDTLVPADPVGSEDVYQYEPSQGAGAPAGDGCAAAAPDFHAATEGCVDLISSGKGEAGFLDASENGEDVFFLTDQRLSAADHDSAPDVYDARVDGGEAVPAALPQCSGEDCQAPPPVATTEAPPASLGQGGPGNLGPCPKAKVRKGARCVRRGAPHKHRRAKHHRHKKRRAPQRSGDRRRGGGKR